MRSSIGLPAVAAWLNAVSGLHAGASIVNIGGTARDVSADGTIVAGERDGSPSQAGYWTRETGWTLIGLPGAQVWGVSPDGGTLVGNNGAQPYLWQQGRGVTTLDLPAGLDWGVAFAASLGGDVVVGSCGSGTVAQHGRATVWTYDPDSDDWLVATIAGPMVASPRSFGYAVSRDGSMVLGKAQYPGALGPDDRARAIAWKLPGVVTTTLDPCYTIMMSFGPSCGTSTATALSADGSVIVGLGSERFATGGDIHGVLTRWSGGDVERLADPVNDPSLGFESTVESLACTADASVVVVTVETPGVHGAIWDETHGLRSIHEAMAEDHGLDLTGWNLTSPNGISDDGRVIVGNGPGFGWVIEVVPPCPGDVDGDLVVGFDDLNMVLAFWATSGQMGDANEDGAVDFEDLNEVLSRWGVVCTGG